ncbi:MAG: hypothetical protein ABSD78_10560 [Acidimicrobiales bacterium]
MATLLDGDFAPLGNALGFIEAPIDAVLDAERKWRDALGAQYDVAPAGQLPAAFDALRPLQTPWSRQLFVAVGKWTMYINNGRQGGDPVPSVGVLSQRLSCVGVVAVCSVNPPHASTQFQLLGPNGKPPLRYIRTLAAYCEDGRWQWHATGLVQPFEDPDRYLARRIRHRLDRPLLVAYLAALGIHVDDSPSFGDAVAISLSR